MGRRREGLVIAALTVTLAFGGCSFAFVYGPPPVERWPTEQTRQVTGLAGCTTSPVAPIVDGAITLGLLGGAGYVAAQQDAFGLNVYAAVILLVPGLLYLASTLYGLSRTGACRAYLAGPPYPQPFPR